MKRSYGAPQLTSLEVKDPPVIAFEREAIEWIEVLTEQHPQEVSCRGVVDEIEEDGIKKYVIRDIFYPEHEKMEATTCEVGGKGEADHDRYLMSNDKESDTYKVRFWGHSHHHMGVSPSTQDEDQSIEKMLKTETYFIRAIFNKKGEMSVSFFDYDNKIKFDNLEWIIMEKDDTIELDDKIERIKRVIDGRKSSKKKLATINKIVKENKTRKKIEKKVKKLMLTNVPEPVKPDHLNFNEYQSRSYRIKKFREQADMFDPVFDDYPVVDYGNAEVEEMDEKFNNSVEFD